MDFRILGPVQVCVDGRRLAVTGKQRALLAVLLLENGEPVTRDRLVEDLWGEDAPEGAPRNAQVIVSRLRAALGGEAGRLVTGASGYRLRFDPDELDFARFQRLCDEGRRALAAGRPERAALRWRAALDEWRGPALADVAREPFAQAEAMRLEGLRTAALEARIEADLAMGRGAELVNELEALVAREPFRERLREHLMLALYRAGRRGEALDAYREAARTLDAGLGLQPGPGLRRLQQEILADDPRLPGPMPVAEAPPGERERRRATATILFTDLARSTPMREQLGDEGADAVRREHDRRLRDVLAGHGGRAVKALGDGLMATFGAAGAAIDCAVEMQRAIDRQATRSPVALGMRIGVGVGDVIWEDDDCHGTAVVQAQRLCAAAGGGQILVADAVRQLAGSRAGAAFEDAGPMLLRGLENPVQAWRLAWTAERKVAVPLAPGLARDPNDVFVGRTAELTSLRSAWGDAVAGRRRGILICGEPGIGKTRCETPELCRPGRLRAWRRRWRS